MTNSGRTPGDVAEVRFKNIAEALRELPVAIVNRIERERWGNLQGLHAGLPTLLTHTIRVAAATWDAIEVLVLTKRHGELLPSRLAVAVPPLERTLLDSLMAIVFILEDPADRTDWYYRSGWREMSQAHAFFVQEIGSRPEWAPFLAEHRAWIDSHNAEYGITADELADPKKATMRWQQQGHFWPNPGKMKKLARGSTADFLSLLNAWFYGQLSGDSHLSYMGLVRRGGVLRDQHDGPTRDQYRSSMTLSAIVIYLALLSEIIATASLPAEAKRALAVWEEVQVTFSGDLLSTKRYRTLLMGVQ